MKGLRRQEPENKTKRRHFISAAQSYKRFSKNRSFTILYNFPYMQTLKYRTTRTDCEMKSNLVGRRTGRIGEGDLEVQTSSYKLNKTKEHSTQHREHNVVDTR